MIGKGSYGTVVPFFAETVEKKYNRACEYSQVREIAFYRFLRESCPWGLVTLEGFTHKSIFLERAFHDLSCILYLDHDKIDRICTEILEILVVFHNQAVLHRDLKLSNILVDFKGKVKFCDLGSCKLVPSTGKTVLTSPVCTLDTRAPEIVLGSKTYTEKSDIWSLGACILNLYTTHSPVSAQFDKGETDCNTVGMLRWFSKLCSFQKLQEAFRTYSDFQRLRKRILPELYRCEGFATVLKNKPNSYLARPGFSFDELAMPYACRPTEFSKLTKYLLQHCLVLEPSQRASAAELLEIVKGSPVSKQILPRFVNHMWESGKVQRVFYSVLEFYFRKLGLGYSTFFLTARLCAHRLGEHTIKEAAICMYLVAQLFETDLLEPSNFNCYPSQVYAVLKKLDGRLLGGHEQMYVDLWNLNPLVSQVLLDAMKTDKSYFHSSPVACIEKYS